MHLLTATHVYTANVGDCKSVLSARGACIELNTCHNPNVPSERDRFQVGLWTGVGHGGGRGWWRGQGEGRTAGEGRGRRGALPPAPHCSFSTAGRVLCLPLLLQAVGIYCSADHIGGSDINVCRTLGDYDLGGPGWGQAGVEGWANALLVSTGSTEYRLDATNC